MGKPELQRIESTLDRLTGSGQNSSVRSASVRQGCSFKIWSTPLPQHRSQPVGETVQPFPTQTCPQMPTLPKFKLPEFSSHHHAANPAMATEALKSIESIVSGWQSALQKILLQIQELYLEGPIIDGWLESPREPQSTDSVALRHAEVDRLMDYVQEICSTPRPSSPSPQTGYRLCGLDADGKLWSRPCPPEQLPHVSLAIARYQKLRQLLGRKQDLEARLSQVAGTLTALQSHLEALR